MSPTARQRMKAKYAAAGIRVMVSAFGSTDQPVTSGANPVALGHKFAAFVKQYDLDGIDVDFEDFQAINKVSAPPVAVKSCERCRSTFL